MNTSRIILKMIACATISCILTLSCYYILPEEWQWYSYIPIVWGFVAIFGTWIEGITNNDKPNK